MRLVIWRVLLLYRRLLGLLAWGWLGTSVLHRITAHDAHIGKRIWEVFVSHLYAWCILFVPSAGGGGGPDVVRPGHSLDADTQSQSQKFQQSVTRIPAT